MGKIKINQIIRILRIVNTKQEIKMSSQITDHNEKIRKSRLAKKNILNNILSKLKN